MTTQAKDAEGTTQQGPHRLLGMVVKEVSMVDRAANKRTFLMLKRDAGGKMSIAKDDNAAQPGIPGSSSSPAPAKLAPMQAQVKDQLLQAVTAAAEKLVALGNQIKEAETTDEAQTPAVPDSVTAEVSELASMLSGLSAQFGGQPAAPEKGKEKPASDGAPAPAADAAPPEPGTAAAPAKADLGGITENGGPDAQGEQKRDYEAVGKAVAVLAKLDVAKGATLDGATVGVIKAGLEVVQKAGRKMAKARLERFRKAMDLLAGIMKELTSDTMRKSAQPRPQIVRFTAAEAAEVLGSIDEAQATIAKQAKTIATQSQRIAALEKGAQPANSGPQEQRPASARVRWPMDMNAERGVTPATDFSR